MGDRQLGTFSRNMKGPGALHHVICGCQREVPESRVLLVLSVLLSTGRSMIDYSTLLGHVRLPEFRIAWIHHYSLLTVLFHPHA